MIPTTNLAFENWTEVLGNERLTGAALDRLTHRCHILELTGESYHLQDVEAASEFLVKGSDWLDCPGSTARETGERKRGLGDGSVPLRPIPHRSRIRSPRTAQKTAGE